MLTLPDISDDLRLNKATKCFFNTSIYNTANVSITMMWSKLPLSRVNEFIF